MKLTRNDFDAATFIQLWEDRHYFRGNAGIAHAYASLRGSLAVADIISATTLNALGDRRPDHHFERFQRDAVMFARMAHKGWRAYRLMVGG